MNLGSLYVSREGSIVSNINSKAVLMFKYNNDYILDHINGIFTCLYNV